MNSIAQLSARSARLNGASALRQANPIARRAFTNGKLARSSHPIRTYHTHPHQHPHHQQLTWAPELLYLAASIQSIDQ
jgi:hypothetical protein